MLDASVLYPVWLRDALLRMAEIEAFKVLWSQEILDEMMRNVLADNPHIDPSVVSLSLIHISEPTRPY